AQSPQAPQATKPKAHPAPKAIPKAAAPKAPAAPAPSTSAKKPAPKAAPPAETPRDDEVWPPPGAASVAPAATAPASPALASAYTAYQRGQYLTAFAEATRLAGDTGDPKAMALLGELYSSGNGVPQDYKKAVEWYRLAADRGDSAGTFALALLY